MSKTNEGLNPDLNVDAQSRALGIEVRNILSELTPYINNALKAKDSNFFNELNSILDKYKSYGPKLPTSGTNIIGTTGLVGTVEKFSDFVKSDKINE